MDDRLVVSVAADGMEARLRIRPGQVASAAEIDEALAAARVTHGVLQSTRDEIGARLGDIDFTGEVIIARGEPAVHGQDGHMEPLFSLDALPGRLRPDNTIDFHEREALHSTCAGDPIARYHPPKPGKVGFTVLGKDLPAHAGKLGLPRLGPGAQRDSTGEILAKIDGVISYVEGVSIDVVPQYVHKGNVGMDSGNLDAKCSITVAGNVEEGFAINGGADVIVRGDVSGQIRAQGNVSVTGGVVGEGARVTARGSIACRHALSCEIEAEEVVSLGDHGVSCRIRGDSIVVDGGRAKLVGTQALARHKIEVHEAGSPAGVRTLLAAADVGYEQQAARLQLEHDKLVQRVKQTDGGPRPGKSGKARRTAADHQRILERKLAELEEQERQLLPEASITISGTAHVGVVIRFGRRELQIDETMKAVRFRFEDDEIKMSAMP